MLHRAVPVRVLGQLALDSACAPEFLMVWSARVGGFADAASQGGVRQQHLLFPTCHAQAARDAARLRPAGPTGVREEVVQSRGLSGTARSVQWQLEERVCCALCAATAMRPLHRRT